MKLSWWECIRDVGEVGEALGLGVGRTVQRERAKVDAGRKLVDRLLIVVHGF